MGDLCGDGMCFSCMGDHCVTVFLLIFRLLTGSVPEPLHCINVVCKVGCHAEVSKEKL